MEWIELGKLIKIRKGNKLEEVENTSNSIRMIMIEDLRSDMNYKYTKIDKKNVIVNENDIVIAWDGANAGTIGFNLKGAIGSTLARLSIQTDNISAKYLGNFLRSRFKEIRDNCTGATIPHVSRAHLNSINVPVPPIEIQEKIVKVLDQAQTLIDKRKEQIEALDQLIESIFYTMFGDPVRNEKGWEIEQLGDLVMINPKKSEVFDIKESDMHVSFVPMKDVGEDGVLDLQERRKLNDVYAGYTYFKENDVLFAKITPCMENGKSCIAKGLINEIGFGSTEFHVIRESTVLTKEYIFNLVRSKKFKEEAESKMTGSAGQKRVPREFLESYSISVPPIYLQNEFAQKVEVIEKQKELLNQSLELLEENYKSIMDKAFKGQLFN